MVANPPENLPRITPYLLYEDLPAALDWLTRVFGLRERYRLAGPDGQVSHAEMELGSGASVGVVMMGCPGAEYRNPKRLGRVTQHLYVYVDDVDRHFERAKNEGARILAEPEDQAYGDRRYAAEDPEGHSWFFAQHVRDVAIEDMRPE